MLMNRDVDKTVCGFCGTCFVFSVIMLCVLSVPVGVSTKEEFYSKYKNTKYMSRELSKYSYMPGVLCSVLFYMVNFCDEEVCTDAVWNMLDVEHSQLIILKCMPKFYRDFIYVPLTTGSYMSNSQYVIEVLQFVLLLVLSGALLTKFIDYQIFLMMRNKYGEE